jgi:hypothetical protein
MAKGKCRFWTIAVLVAAMVSVLTGYAAGRSVMTNGSGSVEDVALTCASIGLNRAFTQLKENPAWRSSLAGDAGIGRYSVTVSDAGKSVAEAVATGQAQGKTRGIRVKVTLNERRIDQEEQSVQIAMLTNTWKEF